MHSALQLKRWYYKMESRTQMASCSVTPLAKKVVVLVEERLPKRLCPPLEPSLACKQWVPAIEFSISKARHVVDMVKCAGILRSKLVLNWGY